MNQTLPSLPASTTKLMFVVPMTLMLTVGTGGHFNELVYNSRLNGTGTPFVHVRDAKPVASVTTADDLAHIRAALKISVQQLADILNVSRQAIYDWKAGGSIKPANVAKLENLKAAAAVIAEAGIAVTPLTLARKVSGGKTVLATIATGGDGQAAATSLIQILQIEAEQQARLAKRFAGRDKASASAEDYGLPHLNERD